MSQPNQKVDPAAYARWYREVRKTLGRPVVDTRKKDRHVAPRKKQKRTTPYVPLFRRLQFVAWDGEGITDEGQTRNRYVMLSNSKRECLRGHDLQSAEIFEFLLDRREDRKTIHCVFGAVYDFTH